MQKDMLKVLLVAIICLFVSSMLMTSSLQAETILSSVSTPLLFPIYLITAPPVSCPTGDFNNDCQVDILDLVAFADQWLDTSPCTGDGCADFDDSSKVEITDFAMFTNHWSKKVGPVVISEFMASNSETLLDEDGDSADWIELYNVIDQTVDLTGWYLTDDDQKLTKWQFPQGAQLLSGQYMLIYATGKNRTDNLDALHTNFKIDRAGEYLALVRADGLTIASQFAPQFPTQYVDVSYGFNSDNKLYFTDPTPGSENGDGFIGVSQAPNFSKTTSTFLDPFQLELSAFSPDAVIRYTLDHSIPNESSTAYSPQSPVNIPNTQTTVVRARVYQPDYAPGPVITNMYIPLDYDIRNFNSNLPLVIIDSFGYNIDAESNPYVYYPYRPVAAIFIDVAEDTGRAHIRGPADFTGRAGMKVRGNSSTMYEKKQYSFETWDQVDDEDLDISVLGFPADSDWALHAPYGDKTLMRNYLAYKWSNDIGQYAVRCRFVEVLFNDDGGNVEWDGGYGSGTDYRGVYVFMEKIRRNDDRVDIARLDPSDNSEPDITGGYIIKHDKNEFSEETFTTSANMTGDFEYHEPPVEEISPQQKAWIKGYLNDFESVLTSSGYTDPVNGYEKYIDVDSFIDHHILVELMKNVDGYRLSTYMHKDRLGKLKMGPIWDFNFTLGNAWMPEWYYPDWFSKATVWYYSGNQLEHAWYDRLMQDDEYLIRYADRWFQLRETNFSDGNIIKEIDTAANLLTEAASRNFQRWKLYVDPYTGKEEGVSRVWTSILNAWVIANYYYGTPIDPHTYQMEIDWIKKWLVGNGTPPGEYSDRAYFFDNNLAVDPPPSFYIYVAPMDTGGPVSAGDELTITAPAGNIYYTTDGSDPRVWRTDTIAHTETLIEESAPKAVLVPDEAVNDSWKSDPYFDDSAWNDGTFVPGKTGGVGYERSSGYENYITTDVEDWMYNQNATCYIRIPFEVTAQQLTELDSLTLNIRYDDAYVAYINGTEVARSSLVPSTLTWYSTASSYRDPESTAFEENDISAYITSLSAGDNILAIHGLNGGDSSSSDFLISVELLAAQNSSGVSPGDVSSTALQYTTPIPINKSTHIKARILNDSEWSALNEAVFAVGDMPQNLRITEIMYNPADPNTEFIELKNIGTETIDLALVEFADGVDFTFPSITVDPNQYILVVENLTSFQNKYGTELNIAGQYSGKLDNAGEEIKLLDAIGQIIHNFSYDEDWYDITDGEGFSLTIRDPLTEDLNLWNDKSAWRPSAIEGGSPGSDDSGDIPVPGSIVINELLAHSDTLIYDWIELYNTTDQQINIGGWFLSDNNNGDPNRMKYQIPEGTTIDANDYIVFYENLSFGNPLAEGCNIPFQFSENGETVYLHSAQDGIITGYYEEEQFGASEPDIAFGRYQKSTGTFNFVAMSTNTPGSANAYPKVGPIVITEIMYHPQTYADAEYIELLNISDSPVTLYDSLTSESWRFVDDKDDPGLEFYFPADAPVTIAPDEKILLIKSLPDFLQEFDMPDGVQYFQWLYGSLSNDSEKPELQMPGDVDEFMTRYYIRIDRVSYDDQLPWPTEPDGDGMSLTKIPGSILLYGNDVINWQSGTPTPGI